MKTSTHLTSDERITLMLMLEARQGKARRPSRLLPGSGLLQVVTLMLKMGWSPQQIAARLKYQWPDSPE